jgi:DNA-binding transcriptional LysR family regulator
MVFDKQLFPGAAVFAAVVEAGSFAKAAEALGITPSAVSRSVASLERRIGVRLLHRTTRSVNVTQEGSQFYSALSPLLAGIEEAASLASGSASAVSGLLRVSVDPFFSRQILAPHLGTFFEANPQLRLELLTREARAALAAEGIDVAVRFGVPQDSSQVAHLLLKTRVLTVASPDYLKKRGCPRHPTELTGHICIQYRDPQTSRPFDWEFRRANEAVRVITSGPLLATDVGTMLEACLAGAGIAQVLALGVKNPLAKGSLLELFPDWPDETFPLYAFYPSRQHLAAKVRVFIEFCKEVLC